MKCLSAVSAKLIQLIKVLCTLYLKTMHCSNTVCGLLIKDLFVCPLCHLYPLLLSFFFEQTICNVSTILCTAVTAFYLQLFICYCVT